MTVFSQCILFQKKKKKESRCHRLDKLLHSDRVTLFLTSKPSIGLTAQTLSVCRYSHKVNFLLRICLVGILREKPIGQMLVLIVQTAEDTDN